MATNNDIINFYRFFCESALRHIKIIEVYQKNLKSYSIKLYKVYLVNR